MDEEEMHPTTRSETHYHSFMRPSGTLAARFIPDSHVLFDALKTGMQITPELLADRPMRPTAEHQDHDWFRREVFENDDLSWRGARAQVMWMRKGGISRGLLHVGLRIDQGNYGFAMQMKGGRRTRYGLGKAITTPTFLEQNAKRTLEMWGEPDAALLLHKLIATEPDPTGRQPHRHEGVVAVRMRPRGYPDWIHVPVIVNDVEVVGQECTIVMHTLYFYTEGDITSYHSREGVMGNLSIIRPTFTFHVGSEKVSYGHPIV